jgi:hypothetical protein
VKQSALQISPGPHGFPTTVYRPIVTADFSGDGKPDTLYWNKNNGVLVLWEMGGSSGTVKEHGVQISPGSHGFPGTRWIPVGAADFNGDGKLDILYWNSQSGGLDIWYMGGSADTVKVSHALVTPDSHGYPRPVYIPVSTGDFNSDGTPDILFWNSSNGVLIDWLMGGSNGSVKQGAIQATPDSHGFPKTYYVPVTSQDFDQNGTPDIMYWNNRNGVLIDWFMGGLNGLVKQGAQQVTPDSHGFPRTVYFPIR